MEKVILQIFYFKDAPDYWKRFPDIRNRLNGSKEIWRGYKEDAPPEYGQYMKGIDGRRYVVVVK